MNGLNISIFVIAIIVLGGIFLIIQKDSIFSKAGLQNTKPIFPTGTDQLKVISPANPQQYMAQEESALPQQAQPTFGVEEGVKASYSAVIKTSKGEIKLTLKGSHAPITVKNFIDKAKSGYYKELPFHRVEDWVIQGGDPKRDGTGGGYIQTELNNEPFVTGSLGMARGSDIRISNDSQFFITKSDANWLTGQYTNFGIVTDGMDVVNKMQIGDKILQIIIE